MRQIKFRVWDGKQMLYADMDDLVRPKGLDFRVVVHENESAPIMQFTGLKDKNGKEIWEGDVVKEPKDEQIWVVEWYQGAWWFMNPFEKTNCWTHDWLVNERGEKWRQEVIGNIYENPELLK